MNALLAIAADFFEQLTDPSRGREVNDSYSLRFHMLMRDDAQAAHQLANAPLDPDDVDVMSPTAWLWYLNWRKSIADEPPAGAFLDALYDRTASPVFRLGIVEIGSHEVSWMDQRVRGIVATDDSFRRGEQERTSAHIEEARELLTYLLDVRDEASLNAARILLTARWSGAGALREQVGALIARLRLDEQAELELRTRLGMHR